MLLELNIKNYKSFKDRASLDMTAAEDVHEHESFVFDRGNTRVLPVAAVYGANASGKSNFFAAVSAMKNEIIGFYKPDTVHQDIKGFIFNKELVEKPSEFEISVLIEDTEYRYGFSRDQNKIFDEWLFEKKYLSNDRLDMMTEENCVYYRNCKEGSLRSEISDITEVEEFEYVNSMISEKELIITSLGKREKSKYKNIFEWFNNKAYVFDYSNADTELATKKLSTDVLKVNSEFLEKFKFIMNMFDDSIKGINIKEELDRNLNKVNRVYTEHKLDDGTNIELPLESESAGTQKLYSILTLILGSFQFGGTMFLDEFDAKLHPLIIRYIINMYHDKSINNGGQLIIASHNIVCLDRRDLRRDEIWFVEKNDQRSELYSLYDFNIEDNEESAEMDFGKSYIMGRFGAVPFKEEINGQ